MRLRTWCASGPTTFSITCCLPNAYGRGVPRYCVRAGRAPCHLASSGFSSLRAGHHGRRMAMRVDQEESSNKASAQTNTALPAGSLADRGPVAQDISLPVEKLQATYESVEYLGSSELYIYDEHELHVIEELKDSMENCSMAFIAVGAASILLSLAQATGHHSLELEEASEFLFSGITVGDVASWLDSLLVAYLLRFGARSFRRVLEEGNEHQHLGYTFQGINRLGLIFQQFGIAALAVGVVTTLEAADKWPPLVSVASSVFFFSACLRVGALWLVMRKYGTTLDSVGNVLDAYRGCQVAAHNHELPLVDRLAIRIAFTNLQQYDSAGHYLNMKGGAMQKVGKVGPSKNKNKAKASPQNPAALAVQETRPNFGTTPVAASALVMGTSGGDSGDYAPRTYEMSAEEDQLLMICNNAMNGAGTALAFQTFASVLLVVADMATEEYTGGVGDAINVVQKLAATVILYSAFTNFDRALFTEGCDVMHLMEGLGDKGLTKLFEKLGILAWAAAIAKGVSLILPWHNPLVSFINENVSHEAADVVLESQRVLIDLIKGV